MKIAPRILLLLLFSSCQEAAPLAVQESGPAKILTRNRRFTYVVREYAAPAGVPVVDTLMLAALEEPWAPDSTQTAIVYTHHLDTTLTSPRPKESSGAFETRDKYLLHPPRHSQYTLLELSPFPSITFPTHAGDAWTFSIYAPDAYANPRWATWEGVLPVTFRYTALADTVVGTPFGRLQCRRVWGIGTSKVGRTTLDSYFHPSYGFVRLRYYNINQTRMDLDMIRVDTQPEDYRRNRRLMQTLVEKAFSATW